MVFVIELEAVCLYVPVNVQKIAPVRSAMYKYYFCLLRKNES